MNDINTNKNKFNINQNKLDSEKYVLWIFELRTLGTLSKSQNLYCALS